MSSEVPGFDIIRPPETMEEKWKESIRIAASVIDANAPYNRHRAKPSEQRGVQSSPTFEENKWMDPESGDNFILRRYWSRPSYSALVWSPTYYLKIYYEESGFSIADPDMVYVFRPDKDPKDKRALQILNDGVYLSLNEWSKLSEEDPDESYNMLYEYLKTATKAADTQLTPRRTLDSGEWADDNLEFAKIILGEAVVASQVHIDGVDTMNASDLLEQPGIIAKAVIAGRLERQDAVKRRHFLQFWKRNNNQTKSTKHDVYRAPDAHPGNWRLNEQALMGAIAHQLAVANVNEATVAEDSDTSK